MNTTISIFLDILGSWSDSPLKDHDRKMYRAGFLFMSWIVVLLVCQPVIRAGSDSSEGATEMKQSSGHIDVNNGKLYYEEQGTGDTVILVHDGLIHSVSWDDQFRLFNRIFRVVRYDRRGYGRSTMPETAFSDIEDLNQIFIQRKISTASVVGCSAGSQLSLDFAVQYPDKVKELVLIGPVVRGLNMTRHFYTRGGRFNPSEYSDLSKLGRFFCLEDPYEVGPAHSEIRQKMLEWITEYPNNLEFVKRNRLASVPEVPTIKRLPEVTCPVLLILGEYDMPDVHAHSGAIAAGVQNARREILSGAGHLAHIEEPEAVNKLILEFCLFNRFQEDVSAIGLMGAIERIKKQHADYPDIPEIAEESVNQLGYQYLYQKKEIDNAIAVFEFNTLLYPDSFNVYDSLGEAWLAKGDRQRAAEAYRKALAINPECASSKAAMEKL